MGNASSAQPQPTRQQAGRPPASGQQQQQQQQKQQQQPKQPQSRAEAKEAAKAAARAAAAGQPRPRPPKGPCGTPAPEPTGGTPYPLPLASALTKGTPPWNCRTAPDPRLAQLVPGYDALRVHYPAGSSTPSSGRRGGVQLRGYPPCLPARDALLRFDFMVAPNFDWTRGGKLGGGLHIGTGDAAGYRHSPTAASCRLTWGPDGAVMLYMYTMEGTQQDPSYTSVTKLGGGCGDHMFPGTFQVQRGVWNRAVLRVRLNTPGAADGVAGLGINGQYRSYDKMVWRKSAGTLITETLLSTFFGGSWSTPVDTSIDFANFCLTVLER